MEQQQLNSKIKTIEREIESQFMQNNVLEISRDMLRTNCVTPERIRLAMDKYKPVLSDGKYYEHLEIFLNVLKERKRDIEQEKKLWVQEMLGHEY